MLSHCVTIKERCVIIAHIVFAVFFSQVTLCEKFHLHAMKVKVFLILFQFIYIETISINRHLHMNMKMRGCEDLCSSTFSAFHLKSQFFQ